MAAKKPPSKSKKQPRARSATSATSATSSRGAASKSTARKPARKGTPARRSTSARGAPATRRGAPRPKRPTGKRPVRTTRRKSPRRTLPENPEGLRLARSLAAAALDKKAADVMILDVRAKGSLVGYDYLVLASGDSERQLTAIADGMDDALRPTGRRATSVEASTDWVLVDYDDVLAHLFTPEKRDVYDLEGFWSDSPRVAVLA
jgi:ribosome-associated protein